MTQTQGYIKTYYLNITLLTQQTEFSPHFTKQHYFVKHAVFSHLLKVLCDNGVQLTET
jgi:hypothetical protein